MFVEVRLSFSGIHHLARVGSTFHRLFAVDQIFISLLLIDIFLKTTTNGPKALPAHQAKKTLCRPSVIQFGRCLQITSPAIDLDIFKLNERFERNDGVCWALIICWLIKRDILVQRSCLFSLALAVHVHLCVNKLSYTQH